MKRAIIYARVSTDDQRGNYSISSQVAECKRYIDSCGYMLVGNCFVDPETGLDSTTGIRAFVDDYSSLEVNRPGLDKAYAYLNNEGFDIVVVYSVDRLDRDPYKLQIHEYGFEKAGASVEYVQSHFDNSPTGNFSKTVIAAAAKLDNDWRIERMNRGKREKARRGLFVAGRAPYGYEINKDSSGGLSVVEFQADAVRLMFDAYVNKRLSLNEVVDLMNNSKYRPGHSQAWAKSSIRNILQNEAYVGKIHYNKYERKDKSLALRDESEWIEISIPPIIDLLTFNSAQERFAQNKLTRRRQPTRFYLLNGLIFCEECRKPYSGGTKRATNKNRLKSDSQYYRHREKQNGCRNHTLSAIKIETLVWESIKEFLSEPDKLESGFKAAREEQINKSKLQTKDLKKSYISIDKLNQMLHNLNNAYIDPDIKITKNEYQEQRSKLEIAIQAERKKILSIEAQIQKIPTKEELKDIGKFSKAIRERLTSTDWSPTPKNKKDIFEMLDVRVYLSDDGTARIDGSFGNSGLLTITYS